ncbi:MAG: hypothetical protein AAGA78_09700 [Pseudomonadota bacterium]
MLALGARQHVCQLRLQLLLEPDGTPIDDPWVETLGLPDPKLGGPLSEQLEGELTDMLSRAKRKQLADDDTVEGLVTKAATGFCADELGKKPLVTVLISRFEE